MKSNKLIVFPIFLIFILLTACGAAPNPDQPRVVATTSIIANVAAQVGGEWMPVESLLPIGTDPHGFDPSPQDIVKAAEADLILANGAGLEDFLTPLIESAGAEDRVVTLTDGTDFIEVGEHVEDHVEDESHGEDHDEDVHENEAQEDEHAGEHEHGIYDPHTWTDPNNVIVWVDNIEHAFAELDPNHADEYAANAEAYRAELRNLDAWVREQVERVPDEHRVIVTDHTSFAYFVRQYGFEQAGTLIPGYSTLAEPTAQELAALEDAIGSQDVRAVFVGNTVNPSLAQRVSEDTGTQLVYIYTGSLSEPGGEADSYLNYIRYNVQAIVDALTVN